MTWGLVAVGGATLIGGYLASENSADAASQAAQIQAGASGQEIAERARQFNVMRDLLQPWVEEGRYALGKQGELTGRFGEGPQRAAIEQLRTGPEYQALSKVGENAILQNASATGGLRGGNAQAALAANDQTILTNLINQQYARLGGFNVAGQNAAAGVGAGAVNMGNANAASIANAGAAQAGGVIGGANAANGFINSAVNAAGIYAGGGGFGAQYPAYKPPPTGGNYNEAGGFSGGPVFS